MHIQPFQAILPQPHLIASVDSFFATVKEDFKTYKEGGFFTKTQHPVLYIYRIRRKEHVFTGIIAANSLEDLDKDVILRHEKTLAAKEQHMLRLTLERRAQIKPVLLAYPGRKKINQFIQSYLDKKEDLSFSFKESKELHQLWEINEKSEIEKLQSYFLDVPRVYVADGHHRCATSLNLRQAQLEGKYKMKFESLLVLYMSFDDLEIHDFNRIIDISNKISHAQLMARLSLVCKIKPLKERRKPLKKHEMTACIGGEWYRLRWKKSILKKDKESLNFDTALINQYILNDILGIQDVRSNPRIEYKSGVNGLAGIDKIVQRNHNKVAMCLYPISADDLMRVAQEYQTLPPKSTWFEPRVKNGMVAIEL
jgi:uncharacterized protein (DUF1015 family)